MNRPIPYQFDPAKPFYPLVVNYVALLWGVKELAGRGLALRLRDGRQEPFEDAECERLRTADLRELMLRLELGSRFDGQPVPLDIDDFAREFIRDLQPNRVLIEHTLLAAGHLLILAYASPARTARTNRDNGPLWEFLRHCRNAAAHGGSFRFDRRRDGDEPLFPAEWGSLRIERSMQGQPLFGARDRPGFLWVGDPIRLLWDIEQTIP
jgi:hypothetical protein